jgi:hypothetical protein
MTAREWMRGALALQEPDGLRIEGEIERLQRGGP